MMRTQAPLLLALLLAGPAAASPSFLLTKASPPAKAASPPPPLPQVDPTSPQMVQTFQKMLVEMQQFVAATALRLQKKDKPYLVDMKERGEKLFQSFAECDQAQFATPIRKFNNFMKTSVEGMSNISRVSEESWNKLERRLRSMRDEGYADLESPTLRAVDLKAVRTEYTDTMRRAYHQVGSLLMKANTTCHDEGSQLQGLFGGHRSGILEHRGRLRYSSCRKLANSENEKLQDFLTILRAKCTCDTEALMDSSARLEYISSLAYSLEGLPADPSSRLDAFYNLFPEAIAELRERGRSCRSTFEDHAGVILEDLGQAVTDVSADDVAGGGEQREDEDGDAEEAVET